MDHIFNLDIREAITCADCAFGCEEENSCCLLNKSLIGYHCDFEFYIKKQSKIHSILGNLQDEYCLAVFNEHNDYDFVLGFSDYMRYIFFAPEAKKIREQIIEKMEEEN